MRTLTAFFMAALTAGCGSELVPCTDDARCVRGGIQGRCVQSPIGTASYCVFADGTCTSGQRWDKTAGDGLGRQCVTVSTPGQTGGVGDPADMSMPAAPQANGATCRSAAQCTSGFCVDGVCCDRDCSGDACSACNVPGSVGTCSLVPGGGAPAAGHPSCGPDDKSTCMRDGTCDGRGACRLWPSDTQCTASKCDSGMNLYTPPALCDGKGVCVTPKAITCAPYLCKDAQNCYSQCTATPGQCSGTNSCTDGSCGPKANGAVCGDPNECASKHCSQGVCCDMDCSSTCMSCNLAKSRGTCSFVDSGQPDPQGGCKTGTGADAYCSPGGCNGSGACAVASATTVCRPATCDSGTNMYTDPVQCGGSVTCPSASPMLCTAYKCAGTTCGSSCGGDGDCMSGYFCSSGACTGQYGGGTACTADDQCQTGICTIRQTDCHKNPTSSAMVCCDQRADGKGCFDCSDGHNDNTTYQEQCGNSCG